MKNIFYVSGLQDGFILSVIVAFAVVCAVAGLVFLCVKRFRRTNTITPGVGTGTHTRTRKVGAANSVQKTEFLNEEADQGDIQQMIRQFRAGNWSFLLLETEQCRIDICTWYVPEGMCSVTIILKLHGQWKALRKIFSVEQGISMFLACYDRGCLYEDFNGWYDVTTDFPGAVRDVQRSVDGEPPAARPAKTKVRAEGFRRIVVTICIMGIIPAVCSLYLGVQGITAIRPASDYEDMGVHTFSPYRVLPHSVENTSTGRDKRLYPTKTVYVVYYQTSDGTRYQWEVETGNDKDYANQILAAGESVDRRVLSIRETGKYMTVDAELTADTYVVGQQKRHLRMVWLSGGYLVLCLVVWVVGKCCKAKE